MNNLNWIEQLLGIDSKYLFLIFVSYIIAFILSSIIRKIMTVFLNNRSKYLKVDPTNYNFLKHAVSFIIFVFATLFIFYGIPELRSFGTTLFAGAGVFAAILAFASQAAFSNIISGVFIVIFKPFRVGDMIAIGNNINGYVKDITLRHTVINDFENKMIVIPNSQISSETIVNFHIDDARLCRHLYFNISFDSDIDKAMDIIKEEIRKHKYYKDFRTPEQIENDDEDVRVIVRELTDFAVRLRANVWSANPEESWVLLTDMNKIIKQRFDKEGIIIPYPHRIIKIDTSEGTFSTPHND
jgi:small-conductance mechanosensitive channel